MVENAMDMSQENTSPVAEAKNSSPRSGREYVNRAQDVVSSVLANGSAIGRDAINKARAFDDKRRLMANASARVVSFDKRVGLIEKLTVGISLVNEKVKSVDQRLQISDKTIAAFMAAERKLNRTGSAVKSSRLNEFLLFTGFSFRLIGIVHLGAAHMLLDLFIVYSLSHLAFGGCCILVIVLARIDCSEFNWEPTVKEFEQLVYPVCITGLAKDY